MGKVIIVTGTPGAGKSTVLGGALAKLKNVLVVNYGNEMMAVAVERGIKNRDLLRKQPLSVQHQIQTAAAKSIAKIARSSKSPLIVDTHSTIKTPDGYIPGMPENIIKSLNPSVIVLIEAPTKQIAKRRAKDKTRRRDVETIEQIELQQNINRMFASAYATMTGASVKIIVNADNKLNKAVAELIRVVNSQR
ncbi:TPA: adenylate kinase [archaeon]|uniref:Adenylate kinase n=1 Tax=Candidatus Naiadarchaeum limnaeum TaxID=2756139 RepID=A0A832UVJ8_9ARCH|nr:adenylate kinase [Candidatus Naiadarchaeum limnaeum]